MLQATQRTFHTAAVLAVSLACGPLWSQNSLTHPAAKAARPGEIVYTNHKYGFNFYLPASWAGYTIIEQPWNPEYGTEVVIRHPLWTKANPREDLPVEVYTHQQWRDIQNGKLNVSAAPFPPSELGHNKRFVFALRPRWNYDFSDGWEEAQAIMRNGLHAF